MVTGWPAVPMSVPAPLRIHTEGARRRSPASAAKRSACTSAGVVCSKVAASPGCGVSTSQARREDNASGCMASACSASASTTGGRARGAHQQGLHECRRFRLAPDARPQHHPPALAQERQKLLKQCRAPPHVPRRAEGTGHDVRAVRLDVPAQTVRSSDADQPASGTQGGPGGQMRRARKPFRTAHDQNGPGGPLVPPRSGFRKKLRPMAFVII